MVAGQCETRQAAEERCNSDHFVPVQQCVFKSKTLDLPEYGSEVLSLGISKGAIAKPITICSQTSQMLQLRANSGYLSPVFEEISTKIKLNDPRTDIAHIGKVRVSPLDLARVQISGIFQSFTEWLMDTQSIKQYNSKLTKLSKATPDLLEANFFYFFPTNLDWLIKRP